MKIIFLATALLFALRAAASIDRDVEKSFTVSPGEVLQVETSGGNIEVKTSDTTQVKVVAHEHFQTSSESEADEIVGHLSLEIGQTSEGVSARAKYDGYKKGGGFFWHSRDPLDVSFTVSIPTRYNVTLRTSGGDVRVADLQGKADVKTSGGNIRIAKIGDVVDAHTSGGNVNVDEATKSLKLSTSGGNVEVGIVGGDADLETSGGDIAIKSARGPVKAHTSGGNVRVDFDSALTSDSSLSTSGGEVTAKVPADKALNLDASTSGGNVSVDGLTLNVTSGKIGSSELKGTLAGGGPELKLRTSGGSIQIEAN